MTTQLRDFGDFGEALVVKQLEQEGFVIRERNYAKRSGEIDIIAEKDHVRAFIEVKTRASEHFCLSQLITRPKQQKIIRTAYKYNAEHGWGEELIHRFDIALLVPQNGRYTITYIPNAFAPGSEWIG